ncbi:MAG: DUF5009 domain-containing protein [Mucilaginibacter polytrichastri]|nr:DUF5009 domain-containing protein [Mucilaginibacter polytrichastri]
MRGLIMVLLTLESAGLYEHLHAGTGGLPKAFFAQFFHAPWHGLNFWDLVQPGFMFMAGVAMAYSLHNQEKKGVKWAEMLRKALRRSAWLFFWGVLDYAVRPDGLSFELWDVLTQLAFTTLVAFLIFRWTSGAQIAFCAGLLLLTEILYRFTHIPNFDQPFTDQHNFGNYMDLLLMNKINSDGWVAINCVPTAVHTIAGALVGKLFLSGKNPLKPMLIWGAACLVLGFALDLSAVTPIIKRIATSSFTLASLGWCLWALTFFYWWIDLRDHKRYLLFFLVVGMNSLFIYLFFEIVGHRWFTEYIYAITTPVFTALALPKTAVLVLSALVVFGLEWGMCWFLYRKKIFFRV